MRNTPIKSNGYGGLPLIILGLIFGFFFGYSWNRHRYDYNPRQSVDGIDTIYTADSVYIIRLKIDSAYDVEQEYEEQPKYGQ